MGAKVPCLEQRGMMKPIIKSGIEGFAEAVVGIVFFSMLGVLVGGIMPLRTWGAVILIVTVGNMAYQASGLKLVDNFWRHIARVLFGGFIFYFIFVLIIAFIWLLQPEFFSLSIENWVDDPVIDLIFEAVALVFVGMWLGALVGLIGQEMIAKFVFLRDRGETAVSIENKGMTIFIPFLMGLFVLSQHHPAPDLGPVLIRTVLGAVLGFIFAVQLKPKEVEHDEGGDTNLEAAGKRK